VASLAYASGYDHVVNPAYTAQSGGTNWISRPPETSSDEPVMLSAFEEAKKAAASPMSSWLDSRPKGTFFQRRCFTSSGSVSQRSV